MATVAAVIVQPEVRPDLLLYNVLLKKESWVTNLRVIAMVRKIATFLRQKASLPPLIKDYFRPKLFPTATVTAVIVQPEEMPEERKLGDESTRNRDGTENHDVLAPKGVFRDQGLAR